jgi:hypothetical protein
MNVTLNSDGTRNRDYRPYIDREESASNIHLYDPNNNGFHHGLYEVPQQSTCGTWLDLYNQFPGRGVPIEGIYSNRRTFGMYPHNPGQNNLQYQQLRKHTRPF